MVVSLNAPDVGFRVGFMSFSLPHSSIRLRLLMARPRARVGDGQRLQRSEGCPLPAKSRVARRMAAYGGTVHSRSALGKNRHRQDMAGSSPSLPDGSNPSAAIVQSASDVQCSRLLKTTKAPQRGAFFVSKRFLKKTFSNTLGRTKFEKKAMTHRTQTANQVVT